MDCTSHLEYPIALVPLLLESRKLMGMNRDRFPTLSSHFRAETTGVAFDLIYHGITLGINLGFYILALIGIITAWTNKNRAAIALLSLVGYFVLLHWLTLPLFRYMLPVMPFVMAFAAHGALLIVERKWPNTRRLLKLG